MKPKKKTEKEEVYKCHWGAVDMTPPALQGPCPKSPIWIQYELHEEKKKGPHEWLLLDKYQNFDLYTPVGMMDSKVTHYYFFCRHCVKIAVHSIHRDPEVVREQDERIIEHYEKEKS